GGGGGGRGGGGRGAGGGGAGPRPAGGGGGGGGSPPPRGEDRDHRSGLAGAPGEGEQVRGLGALGGQGEIFAGAEQPGVVATGGERPVRDVQLDPAVLLGGD